MKVPQSIKSGLRNVFNKVVKGESTADIARKPEAIAALIEFSAPSFDTGAEGYAETSRKSSPVSKPPISNS